MIIFWFTDHNPSKRDALQKELREMLRNRSQLSFLNAASSFPQFPLFLSNGKHSEINKDKYNHLFWIEANNDIDFIMLICVVFGIKLWVSPYNNTTEDFIMISSYVSLNSGHIDKTVRSVPFENIPCQYCFVIPSLDSWRV